MKKAYIFLLAFVLTFSLCACGDDEPAIAYEPGEEYAGISDNEERHAKKPEQETEQKTSEKPAEDTKPEPAKEPENEIPKEIETLFNNFQNAVNNKNPGMIIDCLNPDELGAYLNGLKLCDKDNIGSDIYAVITPYINLVISNSIPDKFSDWKNITLKVNSLSDTVSSTATAEFSLTSTLKDDTVVDKNLSCPIVRIGNDWYFDVNKYSNIGIEGYPESYKINDRITKDKVSGNLYMCTDSEYGFCLMDSDGEMIVALAPFDEILGNMSAVDNGGDEYFAVRNNGRYGFIDRSGNMAAYYLFSKVLDVTGEGFYPVKVISCNSWDFYNPATGECVKKSFESVDENAPSSDGYFHVRQDGKWGMFNPSTQQSISCSYEKIGYFGNGLLPAKKDGYWGLIDKNENVIVDFLYDDMNDTPVNGCIGVSVNKSWGIINSDGSYVIPLSTDYRRNGNVQGNGLFVMKKSDNNATIFDSRGNLLYEGIYDINWLTSDRALIKQLYDGKNPYKYFSKHEPGYFIMNADGETVFDIEGAMNENVSKWSEKREGKFSIKVTDNENGKSITVVAEDGGACVDVIDYDGNSLIGGSQNLSSHQKTVISTDGSVIAFENYRDDLTEFYHIGNGHIGSFDKGEVSDFCIMGSLMPVNIYDKKGYSDYVYHLDTGAFDDYSRVNIINKKSCIIYDGIYYALMLEDGIYGDGFVYNSIDDKKLDNVRRFTMDRGANKEVVYLLSAYRDNESCILNFDKSLEIMSDITD